MLIRVVRPFGLGKGIDAKPGQVLDLHKAVALEAIRLGRAKLEKPAVEAEVSEPVEGSKPATPQPKKWGRK